MQRFVLIAPYRTGSTLLMIALTPHCINEIFHHKEFISKNVELAENRDVNPISYLDFHLREAGQDVAGAKVMLGQLPDAGMEILLRDKSIKKLFVFRENLTDMVLSQQFAKMTNQWAVTIGQKQKEPSKPQALDVEELEHTCSTTVDRFKNTSGARFRAGLPEGRI